MIETLKDRARKLKQETYALSLAARDPRLPWYARAWMALVLAYAFSPIDLIPDFIPVLGYLDDLLIVPLGIAAAIRMVPDEVMAEARREAANRMQPGEPVSRAGAAIVVLIWLLALALAVWLVRRYWK